LDFDICLTKNIRPYGELCLSERCFLSLWAFVKRDLLVTGSAFEHSLFLSLVHSLTAYTFLGVFGCYCELCLSWDGLAILNEWWAPSLLRKGLFAILKFILATMCS
jgi:hypothetical protein